MGIMKIMIVQNMKKEEIVMTEKRFYTDGQYVMQDGEVYVVCGGEHSADVVATALNESLDEIEQLKKSYQVLADMCDKYKEVKDSLENENECLKKELFESEKDYLIETYSDNPTRRDEKIQGLKEEFKERFGD